MQYGQLKSAFDAEGYVVIREFIAGSQLEELRSELDRYIREVVPTLPATDAFFLDPADPSTLKQLQHMQLDAYFRDYMRHPAWNGLAEALIGEPVEPHPPEWFNKPPGSNSPTPPHQDNYYFNLTPPNVLTVWLALDRVDEGNGCLRYVRGSHKEPVRPHGRSKILGFSQGILDFGPDDEAGETAIHLEPGDAVAHHGQTIHRAEPNRSTDRQRRAFAMVFRGVSCRRDEEAYSRYTDALQAQHAELQATR